MKSSVSAVMLTVALTGAAVAGDAVKGRQKASQACAVCHGQVGIAAVPETPNLAAEPEGYIVRQLRAFRSGKRQHEVMNVIARSLSDEEMDNVAAWFSSIRITATAP